MSRAQATLHLPSGGSLKGELVSISRESAELTFPAAEMLEAIPEKDTQLSIASAHVQLNLRVRIFGWSEEGEIRRCRVQLPALGAVEARNVGKLERRYNKRQSFRIDVDPSDPVEVMVESISDGGRAAHDLVDISGVGLAMKSQPLGRLQLRVGSRVKLRFRLEGFLTSLELLGQIQNRSQVGEEFRYGVAFDATESHDFNAIQDLIVDYVMACERRLIRAKA